jgi:hypothetical protein
MSLGVKISQRTVCGESVYIKTLTGGPKAIEIIDLMQRVSAQPSLLVELGALLVVECLCDESGAKQYTDQEWVRANAGIGFLKEFAIAALDVSGLGDDAEEVRKNSEAVQ